MKQSSSHLSTLPVSPSQCRTPSHSRRTGGGKSEKASDPLIFSRFDSEFGLHSSQFRSLAGYLAGDNKQVGREKKHPMNIFDRHALFSQGTKRADASTSTYPERHSITEQWHCGWCPKKISRLIKIYILLFVYASTS